MYSTVSQKYKNEKTRNVFCGYWIYNGCPSYLILDRQITIRQAGALLKISDTIHVWGHFKIMCGTNDLTQTRLYDRKNMFVKIMVILQKCLEPLKQRSDCPGICSRLTTCLTCLSQGQGATLTPTSPERRTYIQPCNWCVKEAKCQQRSSKCCPDIF